MNKVTHQSSRNDLLKYLALATCATALPLILRALGYPTCRTDEHVWAELASLIGDRPPISGPLHPVVLNWLVSQFGLSYAQSLAALGVVTVFVVILMLLLSYRLLAVPRPGYALATLACSSYFWSPLLESRPQQLGQPLVLLAVAITTRALTQPISRPWHWIALAALAILTAVFHILSYGILVALTALLGLLFWVIGMSTKTRVTLAVLLVVSPVIIILWPNGPYQLMIDAIKRDHLLVPTNQFIAGAVALVFAVAGVIVVVGRITSSLIVKARRSLNAMPTTALTLGMVTALGILALQAFLLPTDAWKPYGNSYVLFSISQLGNLFFLFLLLRGFIHFSQLVDSHGEGRYSREMLILATSVAALAGAALLASVYLKDTNWMLRVLNYGLLIIAPVASAGLQGLRRPHLMKWLCALCSVLSILSVLRPPPLYNCG